MIKKNKIPTIIGILILMAGVFAGVMLLKNNQIFKIGASPTITPKDVRIGSLSDSSAVISWTTADQTADFITYGINQNVGTVTNETENDQKFTTHSIIITGLKPESNYYFKINSNGTMFDNNGVPWQFSTGKTLTTAQASIPVSGSVITSSGDPVKRAIVYLTINGYVISTMTSESGTFVLQLGSARTPDLSVYADIDTAKTLLEVSAISEKGETATAKIFPQSANPIPALIIGQDQDFRNLQPTSDGQNPNANLNLPENSTNSSKINLGNQKAAIQKDVTLSSITEGEVVTSNKPEFFGNGPSGSQITITIHSDNLISGTATVLRSGSWSWSPPTNLSAGTHTVTISWIDTSGITRTLTRDFIVQAGELPAFVATPTATPTLSPTPKATATAVPTPTLAPTLTPTSTPQASLVPTPKPTPATLPVSGDLTPTIVLLMMGIAVLTFSLYTWKISEK